MALYLGLLPVRALASRHLKQIKPISFGSRVTNLKHPHSLVNPRGPSMPLIHSKRPAAFKKNVETEMEHGKPLKQSLAIAYREAGEHKASGGEMCAHGGPVKCNMGCYDEGGQVKPAPTATPMPLPSGASTFSNAVSSATGYKKEHPAPVVGAGVMPNGYKDGGEVKELEEPMDDEDGTEIHHALGKELMGHIEKKDHKGIANCVEAMVLHHMNREKNNV